jgi:hypothetical protein
VNRLYLIAACLALAACSVGPRGPVTFTVAIDPAWFSPQTPLTAVVVNREYATREEFELDLNQTGERLVIQSANVRAGERFELTITGLNRDGCNTTTGSVEWVAEAETVPLDLDDLTWTTTKMGCSP